MIALSSFGSSDRLSAAVPAAAASAAVAAPETDFGPYDAAFLEGGIGLRHRLSAAATPPLSGAPWSLGGWVYWNRRQHGTEILTAIGDPTGDRWRGLALRAGRPELVPAPGIRIASAIPIEPGRWTALMASYDGHTARLYVDGREVAAGTASTPAVPAVIALAPAASPGDEQPSAHFGGSLALWRLRDRALDPRRVAALAAAAPNFELISFVHVGVGWPLQRREWIGLTQPQAPWTLPRARTAPAAPVPTAPPPASTTLTHTGASTWAVSSWRLRIAAPGSADPAGKRISSVAYRDDGRAWYAAVVPGTVLTTMVARGLYPDPNYGLNNLAIPESLNRRDYWYRSLFRAPAAVRGRHLTLTFLGINYRAEVWLNGRRMGNIDGAFVRGVFDVTRFIRPGRLNALAVRILPPPHPGVPHEESRVAGPGNNGGELALDGPTFIATGGWDWIPGIRDRDIGIWQPVTLSASGALRILDPQVTTRLPLPDRDEADVSITVPVENSGARARAATVSARFDAVRVRRTVMAPPGVTAVHFTPAEFPQLRIAHPRLWWPNGYGPATLHRLRIRVTDGARPSDERTLRFGMRELTYELSLFDAQGRLRRVEIDPTAASAGGERIVDVRHRAIKRTPNGWAASLTAAGEASTAVHRLPDDALSPYLVLRVNGVRIAARGGSWGMDDDLKRIDRRRLEPYFRLEHAAHLDVIRNWLGQNTEDAFFQLADEYGFLVLNDFWISTQDFQLEPDDPGLFLANVRDVISRYRNHPSIALWIGRNEGVPPPLLNDGMASLVAKLDGTRYYTPSSNSVNLQVSGPYDYRPPADYFTTLAQGFAVEVGTPSLATLESLRAMIPPADRWPLSDTAAYHDWHFGGNGDTKTFMAALDAQYGAPQGLEDFERKAQLMDYVSYRAIFEGFNAHLWTRDSGRLLWMTHPSWPSNTWQIYTSDYDTPAAYYGVKKACEPLHAQLDLPDYRPAIINVSRVGEPHLALESRVLTLDGRLLARRVDQAAVAANSTATFAPLDLAPLFAREGVVIVKLTLTDSRGTIRSDNVYWPSATEAAQARLDRLAPQPVALTARGTATASAQMIDVALTNHGRDTAIALKITMQDAAGARVLPAYYGDNDVTLLPGETRHIEVECPISGKRCARVALRGWDVQDRVAAIVGGESR
ncbi:MAG: glycoside hydrolase family 2 [Gammaproteobacteria bacterium]|nr:glycoside hydrolase family 2 [Gammaproteobacteria bacterium]